MTSICIIFSIFLACMLAYSIAVVRMVPSSTALPVEVFASKK